METVNSHTSDLQPEVRSFWTCFRLHKPVAVQEVLGPCSNTFEEHLQTSDELPRNEYSELPDGRPEADEVSVRVNV